MQNKLTVRIPWRSQYEPFWNDLCANVMEVFGLPGNRYVSRPTADYMDFTFNNSKDYDLCRIMLSEYI
jgi:hypothetical protein